MFYENNQNKTAPILDQKQGGLAFTALMAVYVVISFFIQSVLLSVVKKESFVYIAVCALLSIISIGIVIFYYCINKKHTFKVLQVNKSDYKAVLLAILLSVGMFLGLGFVNGKFAEFLHNLKIDVSTPNVMLDSVWHFIYFSITLALFPAVFEELFFRGMILSSLNGVKLVKKVLTAGLFFALYHCSLTQFVYQFVYGVLLALIVVAFKSVIPCIIAHFANNFVVICCSYFNIVIDLYNIWIIIIGLVCLAVFVILVIIKIKKQQNKEQNTKGVLQAYFPYGIFGVLLCLIMILSIFLG